MAVLKLSEFEDGVGKIHIQYDELVGTGINWIAPARVLGMDVATFITVLKNDYQADIVFYKKDDKVSFVGYSWTSLVMARKFKNMVNRIAREKKFTLGRLGL